jgi:hypothetical protein
LAAPSGIADVRSSALSHSDCNAFCLTNYCISYATFSLRHFYRLAGLDTPIDGEVIDKPSLGLRRKLGQLDDIAVAVFAADWRMIWWSPSWAALLGDHLLFRLRYAFSPRTPSP